MYRGNDEQNNLSRSSSSSSLNSFDSDSDSDSSFSISSSDSDSDSDSDGDGDLPILRNGRLDDLIAAFGNRRRVDEKTYSTDTTREPEKVQIPCPEGRPGCEVLHMAFCVYSRELDTGNPKNLEWLKKGALFPNLEQLKISDDDLKIVTKKDPFKKLKILEVTGSVRNIEELTRALSKTPNLEELILIDTGINQKLGYIVGELVTIKKVTLREKDFTEIPDSLLALPNIEQIKINDIVYDQKVIEDARNSRGINVIDKEKLIQDVKEGHLDGIKQQISTIDLLYLREDLSKVAVSAGQTDVLKFLINDKVDVNARYKNGNTLLMEAAQNNYFDVAKVLISKGANVRAKNKEDDNSSSSVSSLDSDSDSDSDSKTALSLVIDKVKRINSNIHFERKNHKRNELIKKKTELIKMVKLLGNNGADLNEKDNLGQSLLYCAIVWNDVDLVKALLSAAYTKNTLISSYKNKTPLNNKQIDELRDSAVIDVNERSEHTDGNTLLMYAIEKDHNEIVKLLLDYGADVEEKNEKGDTTLGFVASSWGDVLKTIEMLLDRGANINAQNNEGSTPLMEAVKANEPEAAIFLIDKGADPFIKNKKGKTALSLAENIVHEHNTEGRWADFVAEGAERVIEKIKSHKGYKDFEKTQNASNVDQR